jgi:hypothetical protein
MTYNELVQFLRSTCPAHMNVQMGEDDLLCIEDNDTGSQAYVKYTGGLDFSLQGVRNGDKTDTKLFSFKNEAEMLAIITPKILELIDGVRRV